MEPGTDFGLKLLFPADDQPAADTFGDFPVPRRPGIPIIFLEVEAVR